MLIWYSDRAHVPFFNLYSLRSRMILLEVFLLECSFKFYCTYCNGFYNWHWHFFHRLNKMTEHFNVMVIANELCDCGRGNSWCREANKMIFYYKLKPYHLIGMRCSSYDCICMVMGIVEQKLVDVRYRVEIFILNILNYQ